MRVESARVTKPDFIADPIEFWDRRHAGLGPWRSGGDRGISGEENFEFYAYRLGRIIELVRRHAGAERGHRILDAGCGRGHFSHGLARSGHRVTGIDTSPTAIEWASDNGPGRFAVAGLAEHRPTELFDVVICIDVLFHILDDDKWRASLAGLCRAAAAEAVLIVTDVFPRARYATHDYIVHRAADDYRAALAAHDFACAETVPYDFGANPNQFAVYRRRP